MRELVQTFLMLARAQREDASMSPQQSLSQVADGLLNLWREPIESKGLALIFEPGNPVDTCFNATLLHAVMGNLLRNALHYTERGFIRLTLTATGFIVEDSGVGIPEEKREAMFEPFVRGSEKRGEGLGLGLSLVQRICENQGWSVSLTNMEPNGCRFQVELCLSDVS
jgi:signal transduction histidine kinase